MPVAHVRNGLNADGGDSVAKICLGSFETRSSRTAGRPRPPCRQQQPDLALQRNCAIYQLAAPVAGQSVLINDIAIGSVKAGSANGSLNLSEVCRTQL